MLTPRLHPHASPLCDLTFRSRVACQMLRQQHRSNRLWSRRCPATADAKFQPRSHDHERCRIYATESLDLGQRKRWPLRQHQSTHCRRLPTTRSCLSASIPLQLYSQGTPNGVKVTVMLEELLALGHRGAEYDAWLIQIGDGNQFGSGFVGDQPELQDPGAA